MFSRILVPVDLNNIDKLTKALDIAARTAKESDATVVAMSENRVGHAAIRPSQVRSMRSGSAPTERAMNHEA